MLGNSQFSILNSGFGIRDSEFETRNSRIAILNSKSFNQAYFICHFSIVSESLSFSYPLLHSPLLHIRFSTSASPHPLLHSPLLHSPLLHSPLLHSPLLHILFSISASPYPLLHIRFSISPSPYPLLHILYPTLPSNEIARSFWASMANSMGSLFSTSFAYPFTMREIAFSSLSPRCRQ